LRGESGGERKELLSRASRERVKRDQKEEKNMMV